MRILVAIAICVTGLLMPVYGWAEEWLTRVAIFQVCDLETTMRMVEGVQKDIHSSATEGNCRTVQRGLYAVAETLAGPMTDSDGDAFYVVRILTPSGQGDWYTLAWPGFNAPKQPGGES